MAIPADISEPEKLDIWPIPANERMSNPATIVTFVRTIASVALSGFAIHQESLTLLVIGLVVFWAGDSLDGQVARRLGYESRMGAVVDIMCDRFCAAAFYLGLAWLHHQFALPVLIYLAEYMVVDCYLSTTFLAWRIRSPNYFYVIDRRIWLLNWSHPGKATNSGLFAILLLVTGWWWLGAIIATALLVFKCWSLSKVLALGLPIPEWTPAQVGADAEGRSA
jgi:CDP-diacylglycerol--glycerol-3-phosphate 3-phosphatidyltransferase